MRPLRIVAALIIALVLAGCNPKLGIGALESNPAQATVYVAGNKIGETPVQFEIDLSRAVSLRIVKEGYEPVMEMITLGWAQREHREGRYKKGDYVIQGKTQSGFEIRTTRVLQEDPVVKQRADEAKREAQRRDEEEKRILELMDWCKTTVGKDYHEVVNRFGLPRQTMDLPNGNKLLLFEWGVSWFKPRFETDPNGIVIRWTP